MQITTQIEFEFFSLIFVQYVNEKRFLLEFHKKTDKIVFQQTYHILQVLKKFAYAIHNESEYEQYLDKVEFVLNDTKHLTIEYEFKYIDMLISDIKQLYPLLQQMIEVIENAIKTT